MPFAVLQKKREYYCVCGMDYGRPAIGKAYADAHIPSIISTWELSTRQVGRTSYAEYEENKNVGGLCVANFALSFL